MSARALPASTLRRLGSARPIAPVVAVVIAAGIAGVVIGRAPAGGSEPAAVRAPAAAPQPMVHDGVRVQAPRGWTPGTSAAMPGFRHPLSLINPREGLRATVERLPAVSPTLLPRELVAALGG